jgi:hypothetical protein
MGHPPLRGRALWVLLGIYALVLAASPLLHHDLECHLKSPGHCDACVANPLASGIETGAPLCLPRFSDVGRVDHALERLPQSLCPLLAAGRSPPA